MALDYATQTGIIEEPREDIYIKPYEENRKFLDFHGTNFVFRFIV